jgi:NAD(P)-dependent dehydrogenase (short-subunit alcohol dehydrogenase family)
LRNIAVEIDTYRISKMATSTASLPDISATTLFNVNGMVALITGGGSGLGLYAARALDTNGAKAVYIVGRREDTLRQAAATARNGRIKPIVGDVTDRESLQKIAAQVQAEEGFLNLVFANAGVAGPSHVGALREKTAEGQVAPSVEDFSAGLMDLKLEDFTATFNVNITAAFYTAVAFLPLLKAGNEKRNLPQDSQFIVTVSGIESIGNDACHRVHPTDLQS